MPAALRLEGRAVVVTGGESGIGKAIATRCAQEGARVAIAAFDAERAVQAVAEIEAAGGTAVALACDVRDQEQITHALGEAVDRLRRLDAVVANAGVSQEFLPFVEMTLPELERVLSVNLVGAILTLQEGARRLIAQGEGGSLLAIGSSTVFRPHGAHNIGYVAAKGGIHAIVRGLAYELAEHRIRVNAIAPGLTDTPMTRAEKGYLERGLEIVPLGEPVQPLEHGALAALMLSDEVRHMTGSIVRLDAGRTSD